MKCLKEGQALMADQQNLTPVAWGEFVHRLTDDPWPFVDLEKPSLDMCIALKAMLTGLLPYEFVVEGRIEVLADPVRRWLLVIGGSIIEVKMAVVDGHPSIEIAFHPLQRNHPKLSVECFGGQTVVVRAVEVSGLPEKAFEDGVLNARDNAYLGAVLAFGQAVMRAYARGES
jgi:hypothetical protein